MRKRAWKIFTRLFYEAAQIGSRDQNWAPELWDVHLTTRFLKTTYSLEAPRQGVWSGPKCVHKLPLKFLPIENTLAIYSLLSAGPVPYQPLVGRRSGVPKPLYSALFGCRVHAGYIHEYSRMMWSTTRTQAVKTPQECLRRDFRRWIRLASAAKRNGRTVNDTLPTLIWYSLKKVTRSMW